MRFDPMREGACRLIASDLDGTLLQKPEARLSDDFFEDICRLSRRGIRFCVASGRSYPTLRRIFEPVVGEMVFLSENGASAYLEDNPLYQVAMPAEACGKLVRDIYARPDCEVRISGTEHCFLMPKGEAIVRRVQKVMPHNLCIAGRFEDIHEDILKISAFCPAGTEAPAQALLPRWQQRLEAAVTSPQWIDFTAMGKGAGLRRLCELFQVDLGDTVAFGDSFNDISMLEAAGTAYIMESACAELKERFPNHCTSVQETIKEILRSANP